jgi:hypothetical protein
MIYLCLGETEAAETELGAALRMGRGLELDRLVMRTLSALARMRLLAGEREEAAKLSAEAINLLGDQSPPEATEVQFTQFRVLMAGDRCGEALPHLEAAHRLVVEQAGTIQNESVRECFLTTYGEVLNAWEKHRTAPPG